MIILAEILPVVKAIILIFVSAITGFIASYYLWDILLRKKKESIIRDANAEGEALKRDRQLQAKEKFLQLKSEHEKYINEKNKR